MSFRSRRLTGVLLLTTWNKILLCASTRQRRHRTVVDWKHVAWADEARFQLYLAGVRVRIWREPDESMNPTCQQETAEFVAAFCDGTGHVYVV